ncbi:EamA family transporter [Vagococcus vulneris]|uniref:Multidrug transporter n=1 Tax=Vagococcus vulneris TaxID=1977869 RepID=A0A430A134_9ENTE|nr:EamA family transporter [Vagococcus vulneris]RSU00084.1 multidrug transporter [Vagococcus vulneris]
MINIVAVISLLLITTLTGSVGALALKKGMNDLDTLTMGNVLRNLWVYIGTFLYIVSSVTNIMLFNFLDYSIAFPMTSLTYVWTVIISYFIFKEKLTTRKFLAIIFIIIGVFIISQ